MNPAIKAAISVEQEAEREQQARVVTVPIWDHATFMVPADPQALVNAMSEMAKKGWEACSFVMVQAAQATMQHGKLVIPQSGVMQFMVLVKRPTGRTMQIDPEAERQQTAGPQEVENDQPVRQPPFQRHETPGRNDPCHCGSGKKYKVCCL